VRKSLGHGAWCRSDAAGLATDEAEELFEELHTTQDWAERAIVAMGKEVMQPRLIDWAGELPYKYSGQVLEPKPLSPTLDQLNQTLSELCGVEFNHIILNLYRDGRDRVGMHADDEPELGRNPLVASLSLGASRRFNIQHKRKRRLRRSLQLTHGSLLVMGGNMQHRWRHGVPRAHDPDTPPRINVTHRRLMGPPGWRWRHLA